jgi:hypothetical protein
MARGLEERRTGEPRVFADLPALMCADLREVLLGEWRCQWSLGQGNREVRVRTYSVRKKWPGSAEAAISVVLQVGWSGAHRLFY